ncbi:MAG: hypothetical protein ACRDSH_22390 [Pseudonocardiaceae bacterium]
MGADSPELAVAKRLLDLARDQGLVFQRVAPGEDGPLLGIRNTPNYHDKLYISDFYSGCSATQARRYSLIVPGGLLVTARVTGDVLTVLRTVVADWEPI